MQTFRSQDIQKQAAAIQEAAMREPVIITYHDRPRLVLMSMQEYDQLRGRAGQLQWPPATEGRPAISDTVRREALTAYSRGELSRSECMSRFGMEPTEVVAFALLMNAEGISWPEVNRETAEAEAVGLLELIEDGEGR